MKLSNESTESFQLHISQFGMLLEAKASEIVKILSKIETPDTANRELNDAIRTLHELNYKFNPDYHKNLNLLVTYQPSNLPLYSLILYCIVPSYYFKQVAVYVPHELRPTMRQLAYCLNLEKLLENIIIPNFSRKVFEDAFADNTDSIIFNGKYQNVLSILDKYPSSALFIYNGNGFNPFIIDEDSDISLALDKLIASRLFNSGQDCGAPDVVFINDKVYDIFVSKLKIILTKFCKDFYNNGTTSIYPITRDKTFVNAVEYIKENEKSIIFEGGIDHQKRIIFPHIIEIKSFEQVREHFAPIFCLCRFHDIDSLTNLLDKDKKMNHNAMYLSYFGKRRDISSASAVIIYNENVLDIEDGNKPFGGFGQKANFVKSHLDINSHPIHIPSVINDFLEKSQ